MRPFLVPLVALASMFATTGCYGREPVDPSEFAAEDAAFAARAARASRAPGVVREKVTCRCDAEGGLHVGAPEGATVRYPEVAAGSGDAEAEISFGAEESGRPIRRTKSLGFIGDNKLNESVSHSHSSGGHLNWGFSGARGYGGSYGYRSYGHSLR